MAEQALNRVSIRSWPGLVSNKSPLSRALGESSEQTNCRSTAEGVLEVRYGMRPLDGLYTTDARVRASVVYGVFPFTSGTTTRVFLHLSTNRIVVLADPS